MGTKQEHEASDSFKRLLALVAPFLLELDPKLASMAVTACVGSPHALLADHLQSYVHRLTTMPDYSITQLSIPEALQVCNHCHVSHKEGCNKMSNRQTCLVQLKVYKPPVCTETNNLDHQQLDSPICSVCLQQALEGQGSNKCRKSSLTYSDCMLSNVI